MPNPGQVKQKAAKVYLPEVDYNHLQAKLRARGSDVSKWFRERVYEELYGQKK